MDYILRPYQKEASDRAVEFFQSKKKNNSIMVLPTGCHAKGTKILMYDGSIKLVEEIAKNDELMGWKGEKRIVLNLHTGSELLYKITPNKGGESFIVNENHILSLLSTNEGRHDNNRGYPSCQVGGEQVFISVKKYLLKSNYWKHIRKLHKSEILNFNVNYNQEIPSYILGLLLGDGHMGKHSISITSADFEIINEVKQYCNNFNLHFRISEKKNNKAVAIYIINKTRNRMNITPLMKSIRDIGLCGTLSHNEFIPKDYKITSINNRLEILAGLIDTDGHYDGFGGYDYITKSKTLSEDITFIARSLGLSAYQTDKYCKCQTGKGDVYFRIYISGNTNIIPCRIKRKQSPERKMNKNNLVSGFKIEKYGIDNFYGFELDGDRLYLDSNFWVHHNSGKSLIIADIADRLNEHLLIFQPSKEILEQNFAKLQSYGVLDCSIYSASFNSKEISRITFAMIGSVRNKPEFFSHFKYVIIDECHGVNSKNSGTMYNTFLSTLDAKVLGLTATPYRLSTDGFGGSILKFITRTRPRIFSDMIYHVQIKELADAGFLSKLEYYQINIVDPSKLQLNTTRADYTDQSVKKHYSDIQFNLKLKEVIERLVKAGRKNILVFTRFVAEAQELSDYFKGLSEMVSGETPKKERERILKGFKSGEIKIVANVGVLTTGFDFPELETIVLARPTMSLALYYQMIGRAMRPHESKSSAWIIDLCQTYKRFGSVENLELKAERNNLWAIYSGNTQLTNKYYE